MPEFTVFLNEFHWLRPLWLLGVALTPILIWALLRRHARRNNWQAFIAPELLTHLLQGEMSPQKKTPLIILGIALVLACIAMAGPSWEKLPQPIHKNQSALVIMLDLSPSMQAQDLKPSRLIRARLKLIDLLQQRREGLTSLIAYAGESYVITPLTDDTDTIISLLPSLSPGIMPLAGSNTEMALDQALELLREGGLLQGELLLVTDGVAKPAQQYLQETLPNGFRLSVLGVGSEEGAPVPIASGGFAKDSNGAIVLAKLNSRELASLATTSAGIYRTLSHDNRDINDLVAQPTSFDGQLGKQTREMEREFDTWQDRGAWLSILLLPFAALAFRRGWLLCWLVGLPLLLGNPQNTYAFGWDDLWLTQDQQGKKLLQAQQPADAADVFKRDDWKGTAHYQAKDFKAAAADFAARDDASSHYNRGNALAKDGQLQEAVKAYKQALSQQDDLDNARFNKQLVEELLQKQQEQEQEQEQEQDKDKDKDQQNSDSQEQQKQNQQDQQGSDSQDQQNSDPQDQQDSAEQQASSDQQDSSEQQASSKQQDSAEQQENNSPESNETQTSKEQEQSQEQNHPQAQGENELSEEEQQAMEQWLRQIPDDPSGLMREKFKYQYQQRRKAYQQGTWQPPENGANKRW